MMIESMSNADAQIEALDRLFEALTSSRIVALLHGSHESAQLTIIARLLAVAAPPGAGAPRPRLDANNLRQQAELPARPVLLTVHEQRVPCHKAQGRRYRAVVQGIVMHHSEAGLVPDGPASLPGTKTEIDILVIEEESFIQPVQFLQAGAAQ